MPESSFWPLLLSRKLVQKKTLFSSFLCQLLKSQLRDKPTSEQGKSGLESGSHSLYGFLGSYFTPNIRPRPVPQAVPCGGPTS